MAAINSNGTGGGDWSDGASWDGGTAPGTGDDATILDGDTITIDQAQETTGSVWINSGGELDLNGNELICDNESAAGRVFQNGGTFTHSNGKLTLSPGCETIWGGSGTTYYDVEISGAGTDVYISNLPTITNDLYVGAGATFDGGVSGVTINGDVSVYGILDGGTGSITARSIYIYDGGTYSATTGTTTLTGERSGSTFNLYNVGTFTHNDGTVEIDAIATTTGFGGNGLTFYNLVFTAVTMQYTSYDVIVDNDLTISSGLIQSSLADDYVYNVAGDVTINSGTLNMNRNGVGNDLEFGSLTIGAGATFVATSGTTTITSETSGGYAISNNATGTFTHSSGTVTVTTPAETKVEMGGDSLYNFTVNHASCDIDLQSDTIVAGNLTVTAGELNEGANCLIITGTTTIANGGTITCGAHTGMPIRAWTGNVTINSGGVLTAPSKTLVLNGNLTNNGTFTHSSGTVTFSKAGTQIVAGTITFSTITVDGSGNITECTGAAQATTKTISEGSLIFTDYAGTTGDYRIYTSSSLSKSDITNDFTSSDDVTLKAGTFEHDEAGAAGSLTVDSGTTFDINSGTIFTCCNILNNGTLINDGTIKCGGLLTPSRILDDGEWLDIPYNMILDTDNQMDVIIT